MFVFNFKELSKIIMGAIEEAFAIDIIKKLISTNTRFIDWPLDIDSIILRINDVLEDSRLVYCLAYTISCFTWAYHFFPGACFEEEFSGSEHFRRTVAGEW